MSRVRVALIGAGNMANLVHYPSLVEFPDLEIVGLCDIVEEKLNKTAQRFKIERTFTDYKKMLEETEPQAVYILMPPHYLFDLVIYCLKRKLHVFIEKPPGVCTEQTRQMALLAEKNKCLTMVGFQRRFAPLSVMAKKMVEQRGMLQCTATFIKNYTGGPYYEGAIDILTCDAIHAVDNLRWMGGEVKKVVSDVRSIDFDYNNVFNAMVQFESGATGFLIANWRAGKRIFSIEMHGRGISAFVEPEVKSVIYKDNQENGKITLAKDAAGNEEFHKIAGFFAENRHFIDCIKKGRQPSTNFSDAVRTMELVDRIYHSRI